MTKTPSLFMPHCDGYGIQPGGVLLQVAKKNLFAL